MSQLGQLKSQIDGLARQSEQMAGNLNAFRSQFSSSVAQVEATVGGSTQGKDRELISTITQARKQVEAAAAALQQSARAARNYGSSL